MLNSYEYAFAHMSVFWHLTGTLQAKAYGIGFPNIGQTSLK